MPLTVTHSERTAMNRLTDRGFDEELAESVAAHVMETGAGLV